MAGRHVGVFRRGEKFGFDRSATELADVRNPTKSETILSSRSPGAVKVVVNVDGCEHSAEAGSSAIRITPGPKSPCFPLRPPARPPAILA
jgi:hypothetical protein